jgi:hypothetical protein
MHVPRDLSDGNLRFLDLPSPFSVATSLAVEWHAITFKHCLHGHPAVIVSILCTSTAPFPYFWTLNSTEILCGFVAEFFVDVFGSAHWLSRG